MTVHEYAAGLGPRYRRAKRQGKARILDEFCQTTKMHRKAAIRLLGSAKPLKAGRRLAILADFRESSRAKFLPGLIQQPEGKAGEKAFLKKRLRDFWRIRKGAMQTSTRVILTDPGKGLTGKP